MKIVLLGMFAALASAGLPLDAALVDTFIDETRTLEKTTIGDELFGETVSLSESLFEERTASLDYGLQSLSIGSGELAYEQTPAPAGTFGNDRGYFTLDYASGQPVDLLADGATDLRITFSSLSFQSRRQMRVSMTSGRSTDGFGIREEFGPTNSDLSIDIPLSEFENVDLNAITNLRFRAVRLGYFNPSGVSLRMTEIRTIPEPSAPLLGGVAIAFGLLGRRRRSHGRSGNVR